MVFKMTQKVVSEMPSKEYTPLNDQKPRMNNYKPIVFQGDGSQTVRGQMHKL